MQDFGSQKLQWDDLRLVLAVRRAGSFAGAALRLGISTPTVFRRAKTLEQRLGTLVFNRDNTGVTLTGTGHDAAALAERIEGDVDALEMRVANQDSAAAGSIRLATVDTLVAGPLIPLIARFGQQHPAIVLDLRSGIGMADIRGRQVDAALRAGGEPPESLVGRRLCGISVAIYGKAGLADGVTKAFDSQPWVVPNDELGHLASARWLKKHGYGNRAVLRVNSLLTLSLAVAGGLGLGILPCYLADPDPRLVRLGDTIPELSGELWFLTHEELRHTARIRALSAFLSREFQALRPLFEGAARVG